ncbi:MAG: hydrogenase maturation nickel metallochaperone HypA [Pseudonocardiaceae bacterium]
MHELSICRSIADIVTRHAEDREVRIVHVRVGQLRQIIPETLVYCWSMVSAQSHLAGSTLQVESIPAAIRCTVCEHRGTITAPVLRCARCGGQEVSIVAGEEFLITSLELAEA